MILIDEDLASNLKIYVNLSYSVNLLNEIWK